MSPAHRPGARTRAARPGRVGASCLVGAVSLMAFGTPVVAPPPAWADPLATPGPTASSTATATTRLTMTAGISGLTTLTVTGALVAADGTPIAGGLVNITVDDRLVGHATTGTDGRWSARIGLPETFPSGQHHVVALFLDTSFDGEVSASATVQKGSLAATRLSATPSTTRVGRHQVLTVSGRLTTTSGHPVAAGVITVGTPDSAGTVTTGVTGNDGRFVIDYAVHERAGSQRIPVRFDGDDSGRASSTSVTVTVTDGPISSAPPSAAATATARAISDTGPGDVQPADPSTPLPPKSDGTNPAGGPLTSGPHLAFGGVGLLALLTSLAMLGRSIAPRRPREERIRLIDQ